jgi:hypothetical protein
MPPRALPDRLEPLTGPQVRANEMQLKAPFVLSAAIAVLISAALASSGAIAQSSPGDSQTAPPAAVAPAPSPEPSAPPSPAALPSAAPQPAPTPDAQSAPQPPAQAPEAQSSPSPVAPQPSAPAPSAPVQNSPAPAGAGPAPVPAPAETKANPPPAEGTLSLSAGLNGGLSPLTGGLRWRIFGTTPEEDGTHPLVAESSMAEPTLTLPPGDYVVHAAFGLASATKRVTLGPDVQSERLMLSAGGLKVEGTVSDQPIDPSQLSLAIYVPEGRNPEGKLVYAKAKPGEIVGLPEGSYHIVSTYLDTASPKFSANPQPVTSGRPAGGAAASLPSNSIVTADIRIPSGKLVEVTLRHRCASLTLKLVNHSGGEALPNTTFTVLTPGGDVIRELMGAFPSLVLAEGEYVAVARHDAKTYQSTFTVKSGKDHDVEVVAQETEKDTPADKDAPAADKAEQDDKE